jgi:hypothetical protein
MIARATLNPLTALTLGTALFLAGPLSAAEGKKSKKEESAFRALKSPTSTQARAQALAWLKSAGKADGARTRRFKVIWDGDRPLIDKVADTLALGSPEAAKLLKEARSASTDAPIAVPAILKNKKKPAFFRANLTLAYARALTLRKVYEEALESFASVKPQEVVDPSAYFFHKAVCEHALMLKDSADESIDRLLVDAVDAPERYRTVAALMHFDMLTWQEKDLGWIARKMDNIQRRLDLKRGGKKTQKMQKEVLVRLDEMIKELENRRKGPPGDGPGGPNDGNCPPGSPGPDGPAQHNPSQRGMDDSKPGNASGPGDRTLKKIEEIAKVWGTLPFKEREQVTAELTRTMPAKDRAVIEEYFKQLARKGAR